MPSDFLGVGWSLPLTLNASGRIQPAEYEDAVRQSIRMILSTSRGERVMRPDFGCSLQDLVFSNNSPNTIGQVISAIQTALIEWEPRIDVLDVTAEPHSQETNLLLVDIHYQVRTTNNRFNLVYPFYLE